MLNCVLINLANYEKIDDIKFLLTKIDHFYNMGVAGDSTALSIYVDLSKCIKSPKLTPYQALVIDLYYVKGFTMDDIGAVLNITKPTVYGHIQGALKKIHRMLMEGDYGY